MKIKTRTVIEGNFESSRPMLRGPLEDKIIKLPKFKKSKINWKKLLKSFCF